MAGSAALTRARSRASVSPRQSADFASMASISFEAELCATCIPFSYLASSLSVARSESLDRHDASKRCSAALRSPSVYRDDLEDPSRGHRLVFRRRPCARLAGRRARTALDRGPQLTLRRREGRVLISGAKEMFRMADRAGAAALYWYPCAGCAPRPE